MAIAKTGEDFDSLMLQAKAQVESHHPEDAVHLYKKAIKLNPNSAIAYYRMAEACYDTRDYKEQLNTAQRGLKVADTDELRAMLHDISGSALENMSNGDRKKLEAAEHEYHQAAVLSPAPPLVRYELGRVLMKLDREDEGRAELKQFLALHANNTDKGIQKWRRAANLLLQDPRRARHQFMPEFLAITADGRTISSADLAGKIVVFDFWATWCPPCRAEIGDVRSMARRFASDPVVVISISADKYEPTWHRFVEQNKMLEWPQINDSGDRLLPLFGIQFFPTYVIVDSEGIVHRVQRGRGASDVQHEVQKMLKTMVAAKPATEVANTSE